MDNNKHIIKDLDLAFIDTELTGVDLYHELIEIAVVRVSPGDFKVIDEWETKIKPRYIELGDSKALSIAHYNENDWKDAMDVEEALKIFLEKTAGTMIVGHNILYDWYFIHKALNKFDLQPTFLYKGLDTVSLAWQKLRHLPNFQSFSLRELCEYFDVKQEKPHSALDDARTAYKVFLKLL